MDANASDAQTRFAALEPRWRAGEYNFDHFRLTHLLVDGQRTLRRQGLQPGRIAPDFILPGAGGSVRLSDLRGGPVLVHFGSPS